MDKTKNLSRKIEGEVLHRTFTVERKEDINVDKRTVNLAFSSEQPVERYFGMEVLDHSKNSIRMDRISDAAPLLLNHNTDNQIGVIESVSIGGDRVGRATVRFGKSDLANEIFQDVQDGIRKHVSVGYRVHKAVLAETSDEGPDTYRITDWEPIEVSMVPTPADITVGVGRAIEDAKAEKEKVQSEEIRMDKNEHKDTPVVDVVKERADARKAELDRIREITAIGDEVEMRDVAKDFINNGGSVEDMRNAALQEMIKRGKAKIVNPADADLGMSEKEVQRFSLMKLLRAKALGHDDQRHIKDASYELEVSREAGELAMKNGQNVRGFMIPNDVLKRDLNVTTAGDGGYTVATDLLTGSFIDRLLANMVLGDLVTRLPGLQGNVAIPRTVSGTTVAWVAENGNASESSAVFDQVTLSPRAASAYTEISRQLLQQSSIDVEAFVLNMIAQDLALAIDKVGLYGGSGSEPSGIYPALTPVSWTTANTPTWAEIVTMESTIAGANALAGSLNYITTPALRGAMKTIEKASGYPQYLIGPDGTLNGYPVRVSTQVTAGNAFFGNFSDLVLGMWGGLDLMVNPYSLDTKGAVRVTGFQSVDYALRHDESFVVNEN